ncbi:MAG: ATP-binding protein [Steroidobacteraceae bacterium]
MTSTPSIPSASESSLEQRVAHAALTQAYARLPLSLLFTLTFSTLFHLMLLDVFPTTQLVEWFVAIQSVGLMRLALLGMYRWRKPGLEQSPRWAMWFSIGAVAAAGSWVYGALRLTQPDPGLELAILCLVLLGVSSIAVSSLAAHFPSMAGFIITALAPMAWVTMSGSTPTERSVGYVLLASMVAMVWTGWQSSRVTRAQIRTDLELERSIDETRSAQRRAEHASEAKSRFLATMSHELRTPLNGMLGLTDLMEKTTSQPTDRRYLQLIRRSGESLRDILNEILDFSKIEADQLTIVPVEFSLQELLEDVTGLYAARSHDGGPELRLQNRAGQGLMLCGDRLRLRQILANFISNAMKFTQQGEVVIDVAPAAGSSVVPGERVTLRYSVRDTGIGIAADELERMFEPFTQVDDSYSRRFGGTGLGLAICKRLTQLMGGRIGVESIAGTGSTFWIELPMTVVRTDRALAPTATDALLTAAPSANAPRARVLLVEDNEINRLVCSEMLQLIGLECEFAEHGAIALEKAARGEFDLVLMDLQMPVMDGHAATVELRRRGTLARNGTPIPIVALTANAFEDDRRRALESGMDGFLAKPVRIEDLAAMLARWLPVARTPAVNQLALNAQAATRAAHCR